MKDTGGERKVPKVSKDIETATARYKRRRCEAEEGCRGEPTYTINGKRVCFHHFHQAKAVPKNPGRKRITHEHVSMGPNIEEIRPGKPSIIDTSCKLSNQENWPCQWSVPADHDPRIKLCPAGCAHRDPHVKTPPPPPATPGAAPATK